MGCTASTQNGGAATGNGNGTKKKSDRKRDGNARSGKEASNNGGSKGADDAASSAGSNSHVSPSHVGPSAYPPAATSSSDDDEDKLSSISSESFSRPHTPTSSVGSNGTGSQTHSRSSIGGGGAGGSGHRSSQDLSAAREAAIPTIEEEFFVYDDVVINKSSDWLKKARVAGRKPTKMPRGKGSAKDHFSFGDFNINIVDEVDDFEPITDPAKVEKELGGSRHHNKPPPAATPPPPSQSSSSLSGSPVALANGNFLGAFGNAPGAHHPANAITGSPVTQSGPSGSTSRSLGPVGGAAGAGGLFAANAAGFNNGGKPYRGVRKFEVTNLLGHASRVKCIAIAPSETEYVSCSNEDASVTLFGFKTGKEMGIFTGHQDTVINATFSSDGKYLATTSRDHTMILWDVVTAKQILTFDHSKVVICCCFSKDSKYIATGCQDKICRLWETKRGRECLIFAQHDGIIISMSYAPDNMNIVSASADKTLRIWSTTTGKTKHVLQGHSGIVLSCQYTGDGKKIISNDEKLLKVWNANDGTCVLTLVVDDVNNRLHANSIATKKLTWTLSCVAPGEFSEYFFVACNNRFVYLLDINTGEEVSSIFCKAPVYCLTPGFHNLAAFGDSFGNIYVVRIE